MAININPSRINIQSGNIGGNINRPALGQQEKSSGEQKIVIPNKAALNNIPAPETMQTMIRSAVDSMRSGVFWERGTILNLVV